MSCYVNPFAVSTDAAGRFRTGQVKAGEWILVASARGHAPADQRVKVSTAVPQVEIKLGRPRPLVGRVVDPEGRPISGAGVSIARWRQYAFLGLSFYCDRDGRFRWDDASDDELAVNVGCQGYTHVMLQRAVPGSKELVLTLQPCLSIHGSVRDAETKKRVDNATLEFGAVDPTTGDLSRWKSLPRSGFGTGISFGSLSANLPVAADAYKIRIQSPGYQTFVSRTFRREEKAVIDYDILLVPGRPNGPVVAVFRPDGKPLAGARVYSARRTDNLYLQDGHTDSQASSGRELLTSDDGTFAVPQFDEPWVVLILH
jgi:hypothetical protein